MSLDEVLPSPEWAFAFAAALGSQFGDDRILTVGSGPDDPADHATGPAAANTEEATRSVVVPFTSADGHRGSITLAATASFAEALERTSPDEILVTACTAAFDAARRAIAEQAVVDVVAQPGYEPQDAANDDDPDDDVASYPLLDGGDTVGSVSLRVSTNREIAPAEEEPTAGIGAGAETGLASSSGASYVLADVEMGVTAELGRCRMTMRELLSITPGAVIDLDRAAGAPVDVLVNGTLIARGEVVVVDEEFGIRISELVPQPAAAR
jgi:flagellar motor switch protein FliN/FliY